MNIFEAVQTASRRISRRDAEVLLQHCMGRGRGFLLAHPEAELSGEQASLFQGLVDRRVQHWPLQYLTERQEFFGLELAVSRDTLIPRPETELLVESVLEWVAEHPQTGGLQRRLHIVDVGTGTGAIAVALAHHLPSAEVVALDVSPAVSKVVASNIERHGVGDRVHFALSDLLSAPLKRLAQGQMFDVVVSNPPYIPLADAPALERQVRDFEPHLALFAGEDGLEVYRRLIPQAWSVLRPGGLLAMEFGFGQQPALQALLGAWSNVRFRPDYAGIPRLVLAERS